MAFDYRAVPVSSDINEKRDDNERRFRASVEAAFRRVSLLLDGLSGRVTNLVTAYHDPTGAASWSIEGTTLRCWGTLTTAASPTTINLPKTFADATFIATATVVQASVVGARVVYVSNVGASTNSFDVYTGDTAVHQNTQITWHATGKWDGTS